MGGLDKPSNYVLLNFREHVLAHKILIRIYENDKKLIYAYYTMIKAGSRENLINNTLKISLSELEEFRIKSIEYLREINLGENNPMFGKKISEKHKKILSEVNRHKKSPETIEKMRKAQLGKHPSIESKRKMSKSHIGLKIHTEERKQFLSERWKNNNPNSKKVINTITGEVWNSITECANANNITRSQLSYQLNKGKSSIYKFYTT